MTTIVGAIEVGWQLTVSAVLDRATYQASRFGITGLSVLPGDAPRCRSVTIPDAIIRSGGGVLRSERLSLAMSTAASPSVLGQPQVAGAGTGGQITTYAVSYAEPLLSLGWLQPWGVPATVVHRTSLLVKNEPFENAVC